MKEISVKWLPPFNFCSSRLFNFLIISNTLPHSHHKCFLSISSAFLVLLMLSAGRKIARNVMAMASTTTTEAPAEVATTTEQLSVGELPEFVKTIQEVVRNLNRYSLLN